MNDAEDDRSNGRAITALAVEEMFLNQARSGCCISLTLRMLIRMRQIVKGPLGNPKYEWPIFRDPTLGAGSHDGKRRIETAVEGGLLSTETACAMYTVSLDERTFLAANTSDGEASGGCEIRTLSE